MAEEEVLYAVDSGVATITIKRPDRRNSMSWGVITGLRDAVARAKDDKDVRVVVLTGAGNDFCVGADLTAGGGIGGPDETDWVEPASRVCRPMFALDKPVICAVRGAAVGVGSTMQLPADFRLAATDARYGFVFTRRGIYPEGGSTWFLPRIVGMGRALDWMISGRLIPADEALAAGLVHAVHPSEDVLDRAYELARELIAVTAPVSTAVIRRALYRMSAYDSPEPAFRLDSQLIASCAYNPDAVEGVLSFLQHRAPEFALRVPADLPDFLPWRKS